MSVVHHIRIEREVDDEMTDILHRSLLPEARSLRDARSNTDISVADGRLVLDIEAADLVALRAATNTWLGLLETAESVLAVAATDY